jgi:hypothetical protein
MIRFIAPCLGTLVRLLRARRSLLLENLALREQLDDHLRHSLLFFCDQPWSPADPALQRHAASDDQLDHPTAAGSISIRVGAKISNLRRGREIRLERPRGGSISEDPEARATLTLDVKGETQSRSATLEIH